jgi:hypothetical protein
MAEASIAVWSGATYTPTAHQGNGIQLAPVVGKTPRAHSEGRLHGAESVDIYSNSHSGISTQEISPVVDSVFELD